MEIVITLLKQTKDIWISYSGNSIYLWLFLLALLYLLLTEKQKDIRTVLVYSSITLVGLFFFPIFSYIMVCKIFDLEVYYRFLWMLPTGIVTAYASVRLISDMKHKIAQFGAVLLLIAVFIIGGDYTYDHPTFEKAENAYKLPQNVIELCDAIMAENEGTWTRAVFPQELLSSVRQYSNDIHMPYGREMIIPRWGYYHPLFDAMQAETIDTRNLATLARDAYCRYIILEDYRGMEEPLENYEFEKVTQIEEYTIYRDALWKD